MGRKEERKELQWKRSKVQEGERLLRIRLRGSSLLSTLKRVSVEGREQESHSEIVEIG
jgi:hypothetical protein